LWKELYAEPILRAGSASEMAAYVSGVTALLILGYLFLVLVVAGGLRGSMAASAVAVAKYLGPFTACWMFLAIAVSAAGAICGERNRQTLDSLLTTPLENKTILRDKWLGSILSVRKAWWALALVWVPAALTGGLLLALIPLLIAWCVYAAFVAALGLWFSLISRTTLRATLGTLLTLTGLSAAPQGIWSFIDTFVLSAKQRLDLAWVGEFQVHGLVPPITLSTLTFPGLSPATPRHLAFALAGVFCYALMTAGLWGLLLLSFAAMTERMPVGRVFGRKHLPARSP
jgi:ABC-type transport system involved in multi-copper enzyme maturation permease subunit